ncbi:hypothetical protein [Crocinitomix catalasitica]|uniref:hypothetical protein n=1 Tax=Crocinitomix catalasitica TaxID=184607 RepID=UPI000568FDB2|nr:hypothetical protein [Crocinitomix catalasitica]
MVKLYLILLFGLIHIVGIAQNDTVEIVSYELKGKLINEVNLPPHCGYFLFATVFEFEIIEYSDSNYMYKSIGVHFTCPEFNKKNFFEVGSIYKIRIVDEAASVDHITNVSVLEKYDLAQNLWAEKVKKINKF